MANNTFYNMICKPSADWFDTNGPNLLVFWICKVLQTASAEEREAFNEILNMYESIE